MITAAPSVPLPIEFLRPETEAVIVELSGNPTNVHRLEEMGIRNGLHVRMICPGEPCLIAIEGRRMSLRLGGTADIFVVPVAG